MVVTNPHSILEWSPESRSVLEYYKSVPGCAQIISDPRVRPYRGDYPNRQSSLLGPDPYIHGILSREGGLSRYLCCMAEAGVLPALDSQLKNDRVTGHREVATTTAVEAKTEAKVPLPSRPILSASPTPELPSLPSVSLENPFPIHLDFYTLGPALHGIPDNIHGGVLTSLIDAVCGKASLLHRNPKTQVYSTYTNVRFLKPLIVDANGNITILIKSQISHRLSKDRKMVILASVESPEGKVYATGESMCVETRWKAKI